jgi:hypothetical protein
VTPFVCLLQCSDLIHTFLIPFQQFRKVFQYGMRLSGGTMATRSVLKRILVSIWCLFLSRTRENCGLWRETIETRESQYSCRFQRMLLCLRGLAKVGGVESLTLRLSIPQLVSNSTNYFNKSEPCKPPIHSDVTMPTEGGEERRGYRLVKWNAAD